MAVKKKPAPKPKRKPAAKPKVKAKPKPRPKPKPAPQPPPNAYEHYRERKAREFTATSRSGRDIGFIPPIADVERRAACRTSLRIFCETYNPDAFAIAWSPDHLRMIARLEEAAQQGALYAFAMPRGSGKTTVCRMAALWAISYGVCRYVVIIGANDTKATDSLDSLKTFIRFL